ncbi:MAG TPA: EamA family transporter [Deinococcales bacterium]|nr:EamA family transporter [Deinococcales bacterium]
MRSSGERPVPLSGVGLTFGSIVSIQVGAAIAKTLFPLLGSGGVVFLRVFLAALILLAVWRPRLRARSRGDYLLLLAFGLSLAGMNGGFYAALDRIPLGVAVTLEFIGPLAVAVAASRRPRDLLIVALAACGVLLLSPIGSTRIDGLGAAIALVAGAFWAAYIVLAARVGRAFPGGGGLALAMTVAGVALFPYGIAGGHDLLSPAALAGGLGVALLSSAIPYSLELEALRRLPARVFSILLSLEPAVAAAAGFVILGEGMVAREVIAVGLVVTASVAAALER